MLKIENLEKWFGDHPALKKLSFTLNKGEIYGLLGPNGAGKTTAIKIMAGLLSQENGTITINNTNYDRNNSQLKQIISYVPDQPFVYSKLTGQEHMDFFADLYKVPKSIRMERFDFYFKYFEFESYRHELTESYSAGTKQKLLISQAMMVEPQILLLDEPLVSIDPIIGKKFKKILKEISTKGTITIFATHILSLAQEISDRIGIIINGRIITEGSLKDLLNISKGENLEDFYFKTVIRYESSLQG